MKNILNQKDNMFKQVIKTLIQYQIQKTGYESLFTGLEDLREDEVEMLDFLLEICIKGELTDLIGQAVDKNEKLWGTAAKHYPLSVSSAIGKIIEILDKKLHFGFRKDADEPVQEPDTITDISQINMKDRHIKFLNYLKICHPNVDQMFIETYNRTHKDMSPDFMRIERVFAHIRCELHHVDGIEIPYKIYAAACIHGLNTPYFSRDNYVWSVLDSNGFDDPTFMILDTDIYFNKTNSHWSYSAGFGIRFYLTKESSDRHISKLEEIAKFAGFDLSWKAVCINTRDIGKPECPVKCNYRQLSNDVKGIHRDIPRGQIGYHKRFYREIENKYSRKGA